MLKKIKSHIETLKKEEKLSLSNAAWQKSVHRWYNEDMLKAKAKAYRLSIDKLEQILNEEEKSGGGTTEE